MDDINRQQLVAQIPWGHNIKTISKCKTIEDALFYINKTIKLGWSRDMLDIHLKFNGNKRINQPVGVSEYELTMHFPKYFKGRMPTIEAELEE